MLFPNADLERIRTGEVDLAFRRWKRPMHVAGGRQRTRMGVVEFVSVAPVSPDSLTEDDARRAGTTLADLLAFLSRKDGGVYRIEMRYAGQDERVALRAKRPGKAAREAPGEEGDRRSGREARRHGPAQPPWPLDTGASRAHRGPSR